MENGKIHLPTRTDWIQGRSQRRRPRTIFQQVAASVVACGLFASFVTPAQAEITYADVFESRRAGRDAGASIIDMHLHTGTFESMGPLGRRFLMKNLPSFIPDFLKAWSLSTVARVMMHPFGPLIGIRSQCEGARLTHCILFATYAPQTWGTTTNETIQGHLDNPRNVSRERDNLPYFYGFASLPLENWETQSEENLAILRKGLTHPRMKGIKLAFIHNVEPFGGKKYFGIYEVAREFNVPVYHHVGSSPLQKLSDFSTEDGKARYLASYDPAGLETAIAAFPDVNFILGHMGFDFNQEGHDFSGRVVDLARKYKNVWLEISAFGHPIHDPKGQAMDAVLGAIQTHGLAERTLYGSDGPVIPGFVKSYLDATLDSMDRLNYSAQDRQMILGGNARRLMGIPD